MILGLFYWMKRVFIYLYIKYHRRYYQKRKLGSRSYDPLIFEPQTNDDDLLRTTYEKNGINPEIAESFLNLKERNVSSPYYTMS